MESSIRARIDQHLITARVVNYRNVQGGLLEVMPHWIRGFSGLQLPLFNVFVPLDPAGLSDETLADTAAFYSSRNVYYVIELVHDKLPNGPDFLTQRRYQSLPPQPALILKGSPDTVALNLDLTIERVTTVPALTGYCAIMNAVFDLPLADLVKFYPARHFEDERIQHYLAFLDEQPVGGGTTVLADGVASIWNLCTLDHYRRKGVASALLRRMLADTSEFGSDFTVLYSTAQAYQFFNNVGFEIFTQRQWFLPPGIDYEE